MVRPSGSVLMLACVCHVIGCVTERMTVLMEPMKPTVVSLLHTHTHTHSLSLSLSLSLISLFVIFTLLSRTILIIAWPEFPNPLSILRIIFQFLFLESFSDPCGIGMFNCSSSVCIDGNMLCDGFDDCNNGADEDESICCKSFNHNLLYNNMKVAIYLVICIL